jgi:hypothetical protein
LKTANCADADAYCGVARLPVVGLLAGVDGAAAELPPLPPPPPPHADRAIAAANETAVSAEMFFFILGTSSELL